MKGNAYEVKVYGGIQPQQRTLLLPRYLLRRADHKDLEKLLYAHLLQLEAETRLEERYAPAACTQLNSELQLYMLKVWGDKARFDVQLLNQVLSNAVT